MLAYHGQNELKTAVVAMISNHERMDRIKHVGYEEHDEVGVFTGGCAIGCTLESLRQIEGLSSIQHGDHALYERYLGVPEVLARLEDGLFESLPIAESLTWPRRFAEAIRPGADLSMVWPRFALDLLTSPDGEVRAQCVAHTGVATVVADVADLYRQWIESGTKPSVMKWRKASAAASAAADAAYAAAYADVSAVAAVADAAAYAAYAAASAASASDAAYAADVSAASSASSAAYAAADASAVAAAASAYADVSADAAYAAASSARASERMRQADVLLTLLAEELADPVRLLALG